MNVRKLLLAFIVVLFGFLSLGCFSSATNSYGLTDTRTRAPETFHCPPRVIRVAFDPHFTDREQWLGKTALLNFKVLGVRPVVVPVGQEDVLVRHWRTHSCTDQILGEHITCTNFVLIDPVCILSDAQFKAVVVHEIGHWLGMRHVCRPDLRTTDVCSPVGVGLAVLNPYLDWNHPSEPSVLDIAEYNRVCWILHH